MVCIKYFFITFIAFLAYEKSFAFSFKINAGIKAILSLLLTCIMFFVNSFYKLLVVPLIFLLNVIICKFFHKTTWIKTFVLNIFSTSFSFWAYYISGIITLPINFMVYKFIKNIYVKNFILVILVGIVSFLLFKLFFKIKRFRKGLVFIEEGNKSNIGIIIGLISLLSIFFLYTNIKVDIRAVIIILLSFLCCGIFILWWKKYVDNLYITKLHKRDIEILEKGLEQNKVKIEYLTSQNNELAKIIHKDNKVLPAMKMAVLEFINDKNISNKKETGGDILKELEVLYKERTNLINEYQNSIKKQNKTGILYLDAIINYLNSEAIKREIEFNFSFCCDVKFLEKEDVVKSVGTLMADMGINALNSIKCSGQSVKICLSDVGNALTLTVYDTGNEIDKDVFLHMGLSRFTTRSQDGGSGIGLMTVFDIMQKHKSSLVINEKENYFNKSISIRFDKKYSVVVNTYRQDVIKTCNNRGFIVVPEDDKSFCYTYKTA